MYIAPHKIAYYKRVQALLNSLHPENDAVALAIPGSPQPRGEIIVFPGSFNPPTNAHLALLKQARRFARARGEMMLYAAFSKQTVDKERVERPLLLDRVILLEQLLKTRLPHAGILLFNRGLYVEQAQALHASFSQIKRIFFLMGFDKIVQILDPRYYEDREVALSQLFALAELLVAPRGGGGQREIHELLAQPRNQKYARFIHVTPFDPAYRDISSTHIRQGNRVHTHEIPQEVRAFMQETRAYAPPLPRSHGKPVDYYEERVRALHHLLGEPVS